MISMRGGTRFPRDFAIAARPVQVLCDHLPRRRVQPHASVPKFLRPCLEALQDRSTETLTLQGAINTHPFDLSDRTGDSAQRTHAHDSSVDNRNDEIAMVVQVRRSNVAKVVVPRTRSAVRSRLVQALVVQPPNGRVVTLDVGPELGCGEDDASSVTLRNLVGHTSRHSDGHFRRELPAQVTT
jgi:hypothetical protein